MVPLFFLEKCAPFRQEAGGGLPGCFLATPSGTSEEWALCLLPHNLAKTRGQQVRSILIDTKTLHKSTTSGEKQLACFLSDCIHSASHAASLARSSAFCSHTHFHLSLLAWVANARSALASRSDEKCTAEHLSQLALHTRHPRRRVDSTLNHPCAAPEKMHRTEAGKLSLVSCVAPVDDCSTKSSNSPLLDCTLCTLVEG